MNVPIRQITVIIMEFVSILTAVITVMIVNQALLEKEHHVEVRLPLLAALYIKRHSVVMSGC